MREEIVPFNGMLLLFQKTHRKIMLF